MADKYFPPGSREQQHKAQSDANTRRIAELETLTADLLARIEVLESA